MDEELTSLDDEPVLILTYLDRERNFYNIEEGGKLYVNNQLVTPYGTGEAVKYFGINDHSMLELVMDQMLVDMGFDMEHIKGQESPLMRALKQDRERFFQATYETCTRPSVAKIEYDDIMHYLNRRMSIVAVNRKIGMGFFTPPLFGYAWTDRELSDVSAETFLPGGYRKKKK